MKSHTVVRILTRPATLCASLYYNKHECSPNRNLIPECFDIFTGDRFGSGSNCSRSTLHICGGGEKQASPGKAKPLRRIKSSGTLYFSNSGKIMGGTHGWMRPTHVLSLTYLPCTSSYVANPWASMGWVLREQTINRLKKASCVMLQWDSHRKWSQLIKCHFPSFKSHAWNVIVQLMS